MTVAPLARPLTSASLLAFVRQTAVLLRAAEILAAVLVIATAVGGVPPPRPSWSAPPCPRPRARAPPPGGRVTPPLSPAGGHARAGLRTAGMSSSSLWRRWR